MNNISIVIGSWGSYNACNEKALGSKWLNLEDYESWEEIEEELKNQGFKLEGIDEELFIQDIEGIDTKGLNWDYMHPKRLFETLKESGVLDDNNKYEIMDAYLECRNYDEFEDLVDSHGSHWDDDIYLFKGFDWADYGKEIFDCMCYKLPDSLEDFIDFEAYGKYIGYDAEEYSNGIIEIRA